jgi:uncharacterized protein YdeI (YjbR/CyaY-like superfamily)
MNITQTFYAPDRQAWRLWLEEHYRTEKEIWLIYYRLGSAKPRIPYSDAVEEALCFGWIDSTQKSLDAERIVQKFSPRKPGSPYSQTNIERLRLLIEADKVMPEVLAAIGDKLGAMLKQDIEIPADILHALQANEKTWLNFQTFSAPYRRIRIAYVDGARRRPVEFQKRLKTLVRMSEQNKLFGYGIEKFY